MPAVAERKQAGASGTQVDNGEKQRGKCIQAKIGADPRQPDRQPERRRGAPRDQLHDCDTQDDEAHHQASSVDRRSGGTRPANQYRKQCDAQQRGDTPQCSGEWHLGPASKPLVPGTVRCLCADRYPLAAPEAS